MQGTGGNASEQAPIATLRRSHGHTGMQRRGRPLDATSTTFGFGLLLTSDCARNAPRCPQILCVLSVSLREDGERTYFWKNHPGFGGRKCARRRAGERSPLGRRQRDVISGSRSRARLPLAGPDACRSAGRGPIRREFAHPESPVRMLRRRPVARHRATCRRSQIQPSVRRSECARVYSATRRRLRSMISRSTASAGVPIAETCIATEYYGCILLAPG